MRRLTRAEYDNTVSDLLGMRLAPARSFPVEESVKGFDNNADALSFPGVLAEQAVATAGAVAKSAVDKATRWAPCVSQAADEDCAGTFVRAFGKRAWRRPLSDEEVARIMEVFAQGDDFLEGLTLATQALFVSAPFFFRVELAGAVARPATSWEMASRLSYLIWNSLPDDELFALAESGLLARRDAIVAEAKRMLKDEKAKRSFARFNAQWLELDHIRTATKDPKVFPDWSNEYPELLHRGAELLLQDVVDNGTFADLFTASSVFVNEALAPYYGLAPTGGATWRKVPLSDPETGAGILTQGGLRAGLSGFASTSPTFVGRFVRERLLCGTLPPPPPEVNVMIGVAPPGQTTREHYREHIDNPQCQPCHALMDPIGFAFETLDATGRYRDSEHGKPIDASGEAVGTDIGRFVGVEALGAKLAGSADAQACLLTQWFRYAFGRLETPADAAALDPLLEVVRGGGTFADLLLRTVASDAFAEVAAAEP